MTLGSWLIIRGSIIGCTAVVLLAGYISQGFASPVSNATPATLDTPIALQLDTTKSCKQLSRFPTRVQNWCNIIFTYSMQFDVPVELIAAVIWLESGGQPEVISHSGAVGLMQIMPSDGEAANFKCPNGPCFKNRPTIQKLYDPDFNIKYGTRMLASLYKRHGEWREALKAYGPMDVKYRYADKVLAIFQN